MKHLFKFLWALVFATSASLSYAQAPGPALRGTLEGSTLLGWIPFSSGSGTSAVIATQQYLGTSLAGYLPLTGGTLTGPVESTGLNIHADGASILFKPLNNANQNQWRILSTIAGTNPGSLLLQNSTDAFSSINGGLTIDPLGNMSATGGLTALGDISTTGNVNVQGTLSSTANLNPAGPANSGVAIGGATSYALAGFYDQTRSANNRTAEEIFINGQQQLRFKSDDGASATPWLVATGGYASGITGIASSSGSGVWVHSGNFTIAGQGAVLPTGGNGVVIAGTNSSGVPSITTLGAANNISMNIATKGGGGINLQSSTTVTGTMNATTAVQVNGVSLLPSLSGTTSSIGGGLLLAGACATTTVNVTGATTSMAIAVTPVTFPGAGTTWNGYVSSAGVVTAQVCAIVAATPTASAYNVRVIQ